VAVVAWVDGGLRTGGSDGRVQHIDARTGIVEEREDTVGAPIVGIFSAGKEWLALGADGTARIAGRAESWAGVSAATASGSRFALGYEDGAIRVGAANVGDGPPVASLGSTIRALAFGPDGRTLGSISDDRTVRVFAEDGVWTELARSLLDPQSEPALAFSPAGDALAVAGPRGVVELWDTAILRRAEVHP
jgi:WD40 repeat protein